MISSYHYLSTFLSCFNSIIYYATVFISRCLWYILCIQLKWIGHLLSKGLLAVMRRHTGVNSVDFYSQRADRFVKRDESLSLGCI